MLYIFSVRISVSHACSQAEYIAACAVEAAHHYSVWDLINMKILHFFVSSMNLVQHGPAWLSIKYQDKTFYYQRRK